MSPFWVCAAVWVGVGKSGLSARDASGLNNAFPAPLASLRLLSRQRRQGGD